MNNDSKKIMLTVFLVAMVSFGWGISFLSIAILLTEMAPMQLLAARWGFTAIIFIVLILTKKVELNIKGKNIFFLILAGLAEPCAYSILEAYGIKMTSASVSAIFVATIPSMTLIIGILFFHHKANLKLVVSLIITFLGVVIATVFSPAFSMDGTKLGMLLMILAVIAASVYGLSSERASRDFNAGAVTAVMAIEGAILFNIIALAKGHGISTYLLPFSSAKVLFHFLFLSVFCAFASYMCYNQLLSYIDAALANNVVSSLSTVLAVVAGILITKDTWGWYTIVGLIVTLVGVWLATKQMKDEL